MAQNVIDPLGRVGAEDRDPVAGLHVVAVAERGRDRRDEPRVLGEAEPALGHAVGREHVRVVTEVG